MHGASQGRFASFSRCGSDAFARQSERAEFRAHFQSFHWGSLGDVVARDQEMNGPVFTRATDPAGVRGSQAWEGL